MEERDIEFIEDYLFNRLVLEDRRILEERLKSEPGFKNQFDELVLVKETAERLDLRNRIKEIQSAKLKKWRSEEKQKYSSIKVLRSWPKVAVFAAAACLFFTLFLGTADFQTPNSKIIAERGSVENNDSGKQNTFQSYIRAQELLANHDFESAAHLFSDLKSDKNLRAYFQDASLWFEAAAASEFDKNRSKVLLEEIEKNQDFKYPISWMEKMKLKVRLMF